MRASGHIHYWIVLYFWHLLSLSVSSLRLDASQKIKFNTHKFCSHGTAIRNKSEGQTVGKQRVYVVLDLHSNTNDSITTFW